MSRWLWWLGPPLLAIALALLFESRPLKIADAAGPEGLTVSAIWHTI